MNNDQTFPQTIWFRSLGWLPLVFFLARLVEYVQVGTPSQVLWLCHLANLMLAGGLFFANLRVIRIAALLLVFGVPMWAIDMFVIKIVTPVSVATHLGGTIVGLLALAKVGVGRRIWLPAWGLLILTQLFSRFFTSPALDINNAHKIYSFWQRVVSEYWIYWLGSLVVTAASLWLTEFILSCLFTANFEPRRNEESEE